MSCAVSTLSLSVIFSYSQPGPLAGLAGLAMANNASAVSLEMTDGPWTSHDFTTLALGKHIVVVDALNLKHQLLYCKY